MSTTVNNQAGTHLIVSSLEVLGDITNGGIRTIKDNVASLQSSTATLAQETQDYWSEIAKDNVITPEEKKVLYKEYTQIKSEEPNVVAEAIAAGLTVQTTVVKNYIAAYNALIKMLDTDLNVFSDLATNTYLDSLATTSATARDVFVSKYQDYYDCQSAVKSAIYGYASTYSLDLSPEYISVSCNPQGEYINVIDLDITATLYKGADGQDYGSTRKAMYKGSEIGTWDGNKVTFSVALLTEDVNAVVITVADAEGKELSKTFTCTKLYQQEADWTQYSMQLSDNAVSVDTDGVYSPTSITAKKIQRGRDYQKETDYGHIKAIVDSSKEYKVNEYEKDDGSGYDEQYQYQRKMTPFYLTIASGAYDLEKDAAALVFYYRDNS